MTTPIVSRPESENNTLQSLIDKAARLFDVYLSTTKANVTIGENIRANQDWLVAAAALANFCIAHRDQLTVADALTPPPAAAAPAPTGKLTKPQRAILERLDKGETIRYNEYNLQYRSLTDGKCLIKQVIDNLLKMDLVKHVTAATPHGMRTSLVLTVEGKRALVAVTPAPTPPAPPVRLTKAQRAALELATIDGTVVASRVNKTVLNILMKRGYIVQDAGQWWVYHITALGQRALEGR